MNFLGADILSCSCVMGNLLVLVFDEAKKLIIRSLCFENKEIDMSLAIVEIIAERQK